MRRSRARRRAALAAWLLALGACGYYAPPRRSEPEPAVERVEPAPAVAPEDEEQDG